MIRILIVATYASVRAGLHALLANEQDCAVVGEVSGSAELERLLPETRPDVVLFDDNEVDGPFLVAELAESVTGLVVLSDTTSLYRLLRNSALPGWAYLRKEADGQEIAGAIRAAAAGLVALDHNAISRLTALPSTQEERTAPEEPLTPREMEVLQLMAQGLPNKNIAARLSISQHTVKFHVASILTKLGASSRTEAVTLGVRRGYILL